MQVTYGETFKFFESFRVPGDGHFGDHLAGSYPFFAAVESVAPRSSPDLRRFSDVGSTDAEECESPDKNLLLPRASTNCVGNLQLRAELLRISSFLQKVAGDKVIVHNDPVNSRVLRRLGDGIEKKAFVAFDVERMVNQLANFRLLFPKVTPAVRVGAANRHLLSSLIEVSGVNVHVDSVADISLIKESLQDIAAVESFIPASVWQYDLGSLSCLDTALIRSPSRIRAALTAGVRQMCVGNLSSISSISAVLKTLQGSKNNRVHEENLPIPEIMLSLRSEIQQDELSLSAGSSINGFNLLSFPSSEIFAAVQLALNCGLSVFGFRVDLHGLMTGSLENAVKSLLSISKTSRKSPRVFVLLEDLDVLVTNDALSFSDRIKRVTRIREKLAEIEQNCGGVTLDVSADVSELMLISCKTLVARVIGVRPSVDDDGKFIGRQFYVDDGIYSSLCRRATKGIVACAAFSVGCSDAIPCIIEKKTVYDTNQESLPSTVWGQTCDSIDKVLVSEAGVLPLSLGLGDWLAFSGMSIGGCNTSTGFNGYDAPQTRFMVHIGFE